MGCGINPDPNNNKAILKTVITTSLTVKKVTQNQKIVEKRAMCIFGSLIKPKSKLENGQKIQKNEN